MGRRGGRCLRPSFEMPHRIAHACYPSPALRANAPCKGVEVHYRVYKLNPAGGIVSGDWIEADDEADARAQAEAQCGRGVPTVELWHGARLVGRFACQGEPVA